MPEKQTIVINNFGGRLTRVLNGELNSGFAKFTPSFGYDPFSKPGNLTWYPQATSVAGVSSIVVGGINRARIISSQDGTSTTYLVGMRNANTGVLYKIATGQTAGGLTTSVIGQQSVHGAFDWGGSLAFFGINEQLYFSASDVIGVAGSVIGNNEVSLNGFSSIISNSAFLVGKWHPLKQFAAKLLFGNGPTIGAIDSTGTIISSVFTISNQLGNQYSQLNPTLPADQYVHDVDVTPDNNYALISASTIFNERIGDQFGDRVYTSPGQGAVYGWNGVDGGVTIATTIPSGTATALQTYLQNHMLFMNDILGAAVSDGTKKLVTLTDNKSPLPSSTDTNGNFVVWMNPEVVPGSSPLTSNPDARVASLYYYGSLDEENPVGLYRVLRLATPLANGQVYQTPYQAIVSNRYVSLVSGSGTDVVSLGKHFFSLYSASASVTSPSTVGASGFFEFNVTSNSVSTLSELSALPQEGVYETQTQLFPKRIHIDQIRVYTESTLSGNGFQLDIIGANDSSDDAVITNGTFTYNFVAGSDITKLQGSLQRINFNPKADAGYGFAIRITNTGTKNMTIKKIECDVGPEGR